MKTTRKAPAAQETANMRPIALRDLIVDDARNPRPARAGALTWAEAGALPKESTIDEARLPYDLSGFTRRMADGRIAVYINAPKVCRAADGRYEMLGGHRRAWDSLLAGAQSILCEVVDVADDAEAEIVRLLDNEREEIGPLAEARAFERVRLALTPTGGPPATSATVAARVGRSEQHVARALSLLSAAPPVQAAPAAPARQMGDDEEELPAAPLGAVAIAAWALMIVAEDEGKRIDEEEAAHG